ncbi:MAG: BLUF domain-containing protein [Chloroflexota bacterium]
MLISLIYGSTATHAMSNQDLTDIMTTSEQNNYLREVTGILLYKGGNFLQVLEGEAEVVDALYATITRDPRHRSVSLIYRRSILEREFGNWSMGFYNLDEPPPVDLPGYNDFLQQPITADAFEENPSKVQVFLRNFKEMMR